VAPPTLSRRRSGSSLNFRCARGTCVMLKATGNRQLAHFSIDFPSGFLADGWRGVNFTPLGAIAVAGITGLAPWDPSQSAAYREVIEAASVSLGDSRTVRLEGVVPHLGPQGGGHGPPR